MTAEHVYVDLVPDYCRVFELLPGKFTDDIHIILRTQKLKEGETQTYCTKLYHGHETGKANTSSYINVTRNLNEALRYIRRPDTHRLLWVDAICINQRNIAERGEQVQQMRLIYRKAEHVIIWLGPAADDSDWAMETLEYWSELAEYDERSGKVTVKKQYASEHAWIAQARHYLPHDSLEFESCRALIERTWFERLWIRQEIYLSSHKATAVCGTWSLPWNDFKVGLMVYVRREIDYSTPNQERVLQRRQLVFRLLTGPLLPFHSLLHMTSESICGDPRDKIFAILGILDNEEAWLANEMKPDYAISVVELYKRVVKASIQLEERLTILKYCHVAANEAWQPTGAPNWAGPRDQCAVFDLQYADLTMLAQLPKISGDLLAVKGLQAATVADVEPIQLSQSTDFDGQVMELKRLYARFSGDLSVDNSNWFESISHAVSQSKFTEHEILPFSRNRLASVAVLEETLRSIVNSRQGTSTGFSEENGSLKPEFFMFNAHIRETCLGRCFARTDSGHLMLVPDQTRSNDVLAILFGLSLVIVLRPKADHKHRVVGVCFAHGLNWGEALAGPFPPQWRTMKRYRTDGWFDMGFRNLKTEEVTTLDPRIDWEELRVEESDSRRDAVLSEHGQGPYRRPDEAYLQSRGVNVETFQLV